MTDRTAMRSALEVALAVLVVGVAAWLRVVHLGTPSLWWDELVHIRTADRPLWDVVTAVKWGATPDAGNAGAMPVDYLVLHAWLRLVPLPDPAYLEHYFRAPACLWSVVAVVAQVVVARRIYGPHTGILAGLLLATSLPAVLYAAEARSYSLLALLSIVSLGAFANVVSSPRSPRRWCAFALVSLAYVFTGVLAVFVVAVQLVGLAALRLAHDTAGPRLRHLAATGLLLVAALGGYFSGIALDATYPRAGAVTIWGVIRDATWFLAAGSPWLVIAFVMAVPLAIHAERPARPRIMTLVVVGSFVVLPALAVLIQRKHYYFHGRHVLLLLPYFHLLLAAGAVEALRIARSLARPGAGPDRPGPTDLAIAIILLLVVVTPALRAFIAWPSVFFTQSKTVRDIRPVAARVATVASHLAPGERLVVLAERDSTANALLYAYLDWYGLRSRVALRSPGIALAAVEPRLMASLGSPAVLALRPAVGLFPAMRTLLGMTDDFGAFPPSVTRFALVSYTQSLGGVDGEQERFGGVSLRVPAAIAPSPPRS